MSTHTDTAATHDQGSGRSTWQDKLEPYLAIIGPLAMIAMILAFMGIMEPARYFRLSNLNIILLEAALYMPMAMAMTFVITQRGIDLSIGSVAALTGIIMAFAIKQYGFPAWMAVGMAILIGAMFGFINGFIITKFRVPDLIGTLAMDLVYRGFALVLAKGLVLARFPDLITDIGRGRLPGFLPIPVLIGIATFIVCRSLQDIRIRADGSDGRLGGCHVDWKAQCYSGHISAVLQSACYCCRRCRRYVAFWWQGLHARLACRCVASIDDDQCFGDPAN